MSFPPPQPPEQGATFAGTLIVYQIGNDLHHASSKACYTSTSQVEVERLSNDILIPASAYSPLFPSGFTRAPDPLPQNCYIKKPGLTSYDRISKESQPDHIAESVLLEATVSPQGRITGLCFVRYNRTLMQEVSPGSMMKRTLRSNLDERRRRDYNQILANIESGIKHLHSLGLVHNDINPSNIMLDGDDGDDETVFIIDFSSCRRVGESLEDVGRTYEWYDEQVHDALPQSDLDALKEIHVEGGSVWETSRISFVHTTPSL
ncbi:hypothetical protein B0H63DRAFT_516685 [Podospora didyma]|uniref:Protein kinase domain-containing protein n=1 Tax=Podospora didyma TaxID=330526 RepID=A0AAE0P4U9_9PEZI|nr:hypothetical protein B0H63DRAFT_516685 [Podospora didyma]